MSSRTLFAALSLALAGAGVAVANTQTDQGQGAMLRTLDRITGEVIDYEVPAPGEVTRARIKIELEECRYPQGDLASDAFARLKIYDKSVTDPMFDGWMVASSPALSSLEHPRYDVWVLACMAS
ncbi:MAG: DUF2155 domain-containing protein [Pseudomonadota bacterium]